MLFTLEALEAQNGDCLILHYGLPNRPRFIVIDGGPKGVYEGSLKPRLAALKHKWSPNEVLPIEMVMVSHLDSDHIRGVLDWTEDLLQERLATGGLSFDLLTLWHNSFDDIVGKDQDGLVASLVATTQSPAGRRKKPGSLKLADHTELMLASVGESRELRNNAEELDIVVNPGFERLVMATMSGKKTVDWGDGLKFTIISPQAKRLANLQKEWDLKIEDLRKRGKLNTAEASAEAAAYTDNSVYNLSSIVVLAECAGKRILLTGDARGDDILTGLANAGLLTNGKIRVDVLKLPHHGSQRDIAPEFFQSVLADQYVISANGRDGNPDNETLRLLSVARGSDKFTLNLTNQTGKEGVGPRLRTFFAAEKKQKKKYAVVFREDSQLSVKVDLLEPITY